MKDTTKRILAVFICFVLVIGTFAACKKKGEDVGNSEDGGYSQYTDFESVELNSDEMAELANEALGKNIGNDLSSLSAAELARLQKTAELKGYYYDEANGIFVKNMPAEFLEDLSANELKALVKEATGSDKFNGDLSSLSVEDNAKVQSLAMQRGYCITVGDDGKMHIKCEKTASDEEIEEIIEEVVGDGDLKSLDAEKKEELDKKLADKNAKSSNVNKVVSEKFKGQTYNYTTKTYTTKVYTTAAPVKGKTTKVTTTRNLVSAKQTPHNNTEIATVGTNTTAPKNAAISGLAFGFANTYRVVNEDTIDTIKAVAATPDGGFVAAGTGLTDIFRSYIIKYNAQGEITWKQTFTGEDDVFFHDVAVLSDGSIVAAGYATCAVLDGHPISTDSVDGIIVKTSPAGEVQWVKYVGGTGDEEIESIAPASDGGFYIGGYTSSRNGHFGNITVPAGISPDDSSASSAFLTKCNENGVIDSSWNKYYTSNMYTSCCDLDTYKGKVYAMFYGESSGDLNSLAKGDIPVGLANCYGPSGDVVFSCPMNNGNNAFDELHILGSDDGGCYVCGDISTNTGEFAGTFEGKYNAGNSSTYDSFCSKISSKGKVVHTTMLQGFESELTMGMTRYGTYAVITGPSKSTNRDFAGMPNHGDNDAYIYIVGPAGSKIQMLGFGGINSDVPSGCCTLKDKTIVISGTTASSNGTFAGLNPAGSNSKEVGFVAGFKVVEK